MVRVKKKPWMVWHSSYLGTRKISENTDANHQIIFPNHKKNHGPIKFSIFYEASTTVDRLSVYSTLPCNRQGRNTRNIQQMQIARHILEQGHLEHVMKPAHQTRIFGLQHAMQYHDGKHQRAHNK